MGVGWGIYIRFSYIVLVRSLVTVYPVRESYNMVSRSSSIKKRDQGLDRFFVGWLSAGHAFETCEPKEELLDRL
jgi:hypothetical protein